MSFALVDNISNISALGQSDTTAQTRRTQVLSAIKTASDKTGVDFTYLLNKAAQESSFNPEAKSARSSATGLYQFIDQTWLKTVKANGAENGLGDMADKITVGSDGVARVANEADKKAILALRKDPSVSALMAAELAKDNKEALQEKVGGKIGATEMYLAHFLGSGGAANLLNELKANPNAKAADILPTAASANKSVFYDSTTGEAKSVSAIYQKFAAKFDKSIDLKAMDVQVASASTATSLANVGAATAAQNIQQSLANKLAMTSLDQSAEASGSYSSSPLTTNGVTLNKTTSSPFATMVLAQMDMETFSLSAKDAASKFGKNDEEQRRKSVLSTLAKAA